ncbi:MAG: hypothetical protein MK226_04465 [Saprospiraceae bacterium]|nr:hypothetical protein [Saprospiraceae bacterium]
MKHLLPLTLLICITGIAAAQQIENVQFPTRHVFLTGETPTDPAFYEWEEVTNIRQGLNISLIPSEKV